jgi:beta-lactamase regulating signal transducer with metallopeptidase domain
MSNFLTGFYPGDAMALALAGVLLQITVVIVLAALVSRALARRGAAARHAVWLAALGCVLASPFLIVLTDCAGLKLIAVPLSPRPATDTVATDAPWVEAATIPTLTSGAASPPRPVRENKATERAANAENPTMFVAKPSATTDTGSGTGEQFTETEQPASQPVDVVRASVGGLFAVWAAGALFLLLRLLHGCYVLAALRRNTLPMDARRFSHVLEHVRAALATDTLPPIEISPEVAGPVAGGVFRPRVLLPKGLADSLDAARLRDVLIHECAHVLRRDHLIGLLQRVAGALFWPHPLVHYANRRLAQAREEICDNYVLQHGDACTYARTLLTLAERGGACRPLAAACLIDPHWKLADRVAGLLDSRRTLMTHISPWSFAGILAILLTAGIAVAAVRLGGEPANDDPKTQDAEKETKPDVSKARIEGVVVDEAGIPVAGVVVGLTERRAGAGSVTVRTAADGSFRLPLDEASARYQTIRATTDGGKRQGIFEFHDTVLGNVASARMVLKPSKTITVRVTDAKKAPVAKATVGVVALYTVVASAETNTRGLASLLVPADAKVSQVVALKSGVGFDYFENYRSWPGSVVGPMPAQVALALDGAQSITVKAVDSGGIALEGVDFVPWSIQKKGRLGYVNIGGALKSMTARTDREGIALFDWIPRDLHQGVTALQLNDAYSLPDAPHFDPAKPVVPLLARLFRNVPISGKVTLPNGKPAVGILLQVEGRGNTNHYCRNVVRTRADGTYSLLVYPNQSYLIAVTDDQWAATSIQGVHVREDEPREDLKFRLGKGTLIHGNITLGRDKKPAANQTVTLIEQGAPIAPELRGNWGHDRESLVRWATTDKDGRYSIRAGPGEYRFYQSGDKQENLTVRDEQTIERNFHIDRLPRGVLKGEALAHAVDGKPVAGAIIKGESIDALGHAGFEVVANDKGHFETERWRDKMHVYARSPDGKLATIVTIGEDDEEVRMLLGAAGTLKGRLVNKAGKPVVGVRVSCALQIGPVDEPRAPAWFYVETDKEGRFTLGGLLLGARCNVSALTNKASEQLKQLTVERAETQELGDLIFDPPDK